MALTKRAKALAKKLGVAPEQVRKIVEGNADLAAETVRAALQRFIDQIINTSPSGAMNGYTAVVNKGKRESIRLPKSKVTISGDWDFLITVEPNATHKAAGLNVFNILDVGHEGVKETGKPIPLWNSAEDGSSTRRVLERGRGGRIAVSKNVNRTAIRPEPGRGQYSGDKKIAFTMGPIAPLPSLRLYERAEAAAKDALAGQGFTQWDVIYVGPNAKD